MERRVALQQLLQEAEGPLSGTELANRLGVTRQVIVRDMALLRAQGAPVVATPRGYVWQKPVRSGVEAVVTVRHAREEIADELCCVVDRGGKALTTMVEHPAYGQLEEDLNVGSRRDIALFLKRIQDSAPLLALTGGVHRHRIWAPDEDALAEILAALSERGFLLSETGKAGGASLTGTSRPPADGSGQEGLDF